MAKQIQPIPEGFHTLTAYLLVADAEQEVEFARKAFDAQTIHVSRLPDGSIMHATLKIGTSMLMLGQVQGNMKPVPSMLFMYVENADTAYRHAVECGGKPLHEPMDQIWGDRAGAIASPNGIQWWISTHIAEVSESELQRRMAARSAAAGG
jgi:PhnB protein